jgi:hypothetical protein
MVANPSLGEMGDPLDWVLVMDGLAESRGGYCRCRAEVMHWVLSEDSTGMELGEIGVRG